MSVVSQLFQSHTIPSQTSQDYVTFQCTRFAEKLCYNDSWENAAMPSPVDIQHITANFLKTASHQLPNYDEQLAKIPATKFRISVKGSFKL